MDFFEYSSKSNPIRLLTMTRRLLNHSIVWQAHRLVINRRILFDKYLQQQYHVNELVRIDYFE